jgi:hypothetical protein
MSELLVRPSSWDLPLFVHVAGAMMVYASLVVAVAVLVVARRSEGDERGAITRFGFRTLLFVAIPSYLVMRIGAEWVLGRENLNENAAWIGIGFSTADLGGLLLIIATILTGLGARRLRSGGGGARLATTGTFIVGFVIVIYTIAVWAMTTKPS